MQTRSMTKKSLTSSMENLILASEKSRLESEKIRQASEKARLASEKTRLESEILRLKSEKLILELDILLGNKPHNNTIQPRRSERLKQKNRKELPVEIDFDSASKAWMSNKIKLSDGMYRYKKK